MNKLLLFSLSLLFFSTINAQNHSLILKGITKSNAINKTNSSTSINVSSISPQGRTCATMDVYQQNIQQNTKAETLEQFENWLQQKMSQPLSQKSMALQIIPVVVHVVHDGESVGTGRNISALQVESQITVLNEDFRKMAGTPGYNNETNGADVEVEFCLAQINPNGGLMSEPGINRINRSTAGFSAPPYTTSYIDNTIKPATYWDPNNYFNIWVCEISGSILGYAQFPSSSGLSGMPSNGGAASTDGVVVGYQFFGSTDKGTFPVLQSPYDKGRTASHEVGHWLGLRHIWGDGGCSADDYCTDTPTSDSPNYGCPTNTVKCGSTDMVRNYMDYTDDPCMNIFTTCQKSRIKTVLANSPRRNTLPSSTACNSSAVPNTDFTANITTVTAGGYVSFTDLSTGSPSSWSWDFGTGGTPNTSTQQNPVIQFNTPGTYTVSLIASNGNGSNTETKTNYITVTLSTGCDTITNFTGSNLYTYVVDQASPYDSGYVAGNNIYGDKAKADFFTNPAPYSYITGAAFYFSKAIFTSPSSMATIAVWDNTGASGTPGATPIATKAVPISSLLTAGAASVIYFNSPVYVSADFYLGVILPTNTGDTVAIYTNQINSININSAWEQWSDNTWHDFPSGWGSSVKLNHAIFAFVTDAPPTASFTNLNPSVCEGASATYDASSSLNAMSYSWTFPGGTPSTSTTVNPTVTYATPGTYNATLVIQGNCGSKDSITQINAINVTASPSLSISSTMASCFGANDGSASVTATGGTTPYTYLWSNNETTSSINSIAAGYYTVTVTDNNGCSEIASVNINEPTAIAATFTTTNENCGNADGTATVTASGGVGSYAYAWNTSPIQTGQTATGLSSGSYSVTVTDANACSQSFSVTISNTPGPSVTISTTNASCGNANGIATANVIGGTSPFSYSWNTTPVQTTQTISGLSAGIYTVTVTDYNNCIGTASDTINNSTGLVLTLSSTNASCGTNNGSATAVPNGTAPYTYSWNTSPVQTTQTATGLAAGTYTVDVIDDAGCSATENITISTTSPPMVTVTQTNNTCFGSCNASALANVSGGTAPYSYLWSNNQTTSSISNLCSGPYSVQITDSDGCSDTFSFTITEPSAISITSSVVHETCNNVNGSASVTVSGGTPGYSYQWNTNPIQTTATASNLSAGIYTCTVTDANSCVETTTVTINNTGNISLTASANQTICEGTTVGISVTTSGGSSPYNFSWSHGATTSSTNVSPIVTTTYTVTVTDATGCTNSDSTLIIVDPAPVTTVSADDTICSGENTVLTASGGTSYLWSNGATSSSITVSPSSTTSFTVKAIDGGCEGNLAQVTVYVQAMPTVVMTASPTQVLLSQGGTINFYSSGSNATGFLWNFGDGNSSTQANPVHSYLLPGIFNVTLNTSIGNCSAVDSINVEVTNDVGIIENENILQSLIVYPVPSSDYVSITFEVSKLQDILFTVYNHLGELIVKNKLDKINGKNNFTLDFSEKAAGIYFLQVLSTEGLVTKKIIINK